MRLEQQKQTIQMRAQMPAFSLPYAQARTPAGPTPSRGRPRPRTAPTALTVVSLCPQLQAVPAAGGVLYQPSGPTSFPGTFSPAGSVEGSPMHTVYMSQPAPTAGSPYPGMPGAGAGNRAGTSDEPQTTSLSFFVLE